MAPQPNGGAGENCLALRGGRDGRWADYGCTVTAVKRYICQKGRASSAGRIEWEQFSGAEYAYVEDQCVGSAQDAVDACQTHGAKLASIISQEVSTFLTNSFGPFNTEFVWIGGNDIEREGTFAWRRGDSWDWTNWQAQAQNSRRADCMVISPNADSKWRMISCRSRGVQAYLCQKGGPTPARQFQDGRYDNYAIDDEYEIGETDATGSGQACCDSCAAAHPETDRVSWRTGNKCVCHNTNGQSEGFIIHYENNWEYGDCAASKRY